MSVELLAHRDPAIAAAIHAIQMAAYAQEARLLEIRHFPPLAVTVDDVRCSADTFFGARVDDAIAGVIGVDQRPGQPTLIASLVVLPRCQRRGLARALLSFVVERFGGDEIVVSTGVKNKPALALYAGFGFVESRRWTVGAEALALIELRRANT